MLQNPDMVSGALGAAARDEAVCYLTGGATALLVGWRRATVDVEPRWEE